jgi:hypothetical protein
MNWKEESFVGQPFRKTLAYEFGRGTASLPECFPLSENERSRNCMAFSGRGERDTYNFALSHRDNNYA